RKLHVEGLGRGLPDPASLINGAQQRLDDRAERLVLGLRQQLRRSRDRLIALAARVNVNLLNGEIARTRARIDEIGPRLQAAVERQIAQHRNSADNVGGRLLTAYQALRKPLLRGYAMVRDAKGKLVTDAAKVKADSTLSLEFHDGKIEVATPGTKQGKLL
ncbi:MAG: exodeoxyribonuclease VII large subunit, partial [Stellaceae bacterium]